MSTSSQSLIILMRSSCNKNCHIEKILLTRLYLIMLISFPGFKPSISFRVVSAEEKELDYSTMINALAIYQRSFKDCNVVIIGELSDPYWQQIQCSIPPGHLQFIYAENEAHVTQIILCYISVARESSERKQMQEAYFDQVIIR